MARERPSGWVATAAAAGAMATIAGGTYLLTRTTPPKPTKTSAPVFEIVVVSIRQPVVPGQVAQAAVTVANTGQGTGTVTVTGRTLRDGNAEGEWTMATATLSPGQSTTLTLETAGAISSEFAGDTLTVIFTTSDGHTAQATFQVEGVPEFTIQVTSITSPVLVGQYAQAQVEVTNTGSASGTVTVTGVTEYNGTVEGHWS